MPLPSRLMASLLPFLLTASIASAEIRRHAVSPPAAATSDTLIEDALRKGEIDSQTALMDRVFADTGDARLPDRFHGNVLANTDSTSLAEAVAQWDSLSEATQEAIAPYLIPPFQKGSAITASRAHTLLNPLQLCGPVDTDNWSSVEAQSGRLRVWWNKIHPEDAQVARDLASDGDLALQQYTSLLGDVEIPDGGSILPCRGGDDAIDVALSDIPRSQTVPFIGLKAIPSFVLLQRNADDGPEATLAHELFHVMQFTYDVSDFSVAGNYKWLMEATAQWAMDYHLRAGNAGREQRAAPLWLNDPDKSLTLVDDAGHEYGAYLFFLYLSRTYGDSIISDIWNATESHNEIDAVDSVIPGGFKERWPDFAVDAWNEAPNDKFNQWDQISLKPFAQTGTLLGGQPDLYVNLSANLPALSAKYVHIVFDSTVRSVGFLNGLTYDLSLLTSNPGPINFAPLYQWSDASDDAKRGASIHAIIKKNGQWQAPEDWSNTKLQAFCFSKPEERIDELVLVITNSDTDEKRTLKSSDIDSQLIVTNIGCEWTGTADFTSGGVEQYNVGNMTEHHATTKEPTPGATPSETQPGYRYTTTGTATYSISGTSQAPCTVSGGGNIALIPLDNYTYNFVPQTSAVYRKAQFMELEQPDIPYTLNCPNANPFQTSAAPTGALFPPDPLNSFLDIGPDGKIKGQKGDGEGGTWKWEFSPK